MLGNWTQEPSPSPDPTPARQWTSQTQLQWHVCHSNLSQLVGSPQVHPKRITWHSLRHTFISRLVRVDLRTVMDLAGHKTTQMTMPYAHLAPGHAKAALEKASATTGATSAASQIFSVAQIDNKSLTVH